MSYNVLLSHEALGDEKQGYFYYALIEGQLAEKFLSALERSYAQLTDHPEYYGFVDERKIIRRIKVDGFPYIVIYEIVGATVFYSGYTQHVQAI
jgi:toxin ParE1/3/4